MQTAKIKKQLKSSSSTDAEGQESLASCSTGNTAKDKHDAFPSDTLNYILFERIFFGMVDPKMPDGSWALHRSLSQNKTIVASQLGTAGENGLEIAPLYIKQIVFDQKLNFEVFFVNTRTVLKDKPKVPESLEEFQDILAYISDIKLCEGGPAVVEYSNVDLECAYKDPTEKWRHNLCSLETNDESVCKSCFSLQEILQRHVQRNKLSGRSLMNSRKTKRKVGSRRAKRV